MRVSSRQKIGTCTHIGSFRLRDDLDLGFGGLGLAAAGFAAGVRACYGYLVFALGGSLSGIE